MKRLWSPDLEFDLADLLSHEYFHSFNGKFRRPAGLATPDFGAAMKGDLLWVYEGLTQFYGHVLPRLRRCVDGREVAGRARRRLSRHPLFHGQRLASAQRHRGRDSTHVQFSGAWARARRGADFYTEMVSVWLEVHSILNGLTNGQKGIDDFAREFLGGPSNGPELKPYAYTDVIATLDRVAPYNWDGFFKKRVYSVQPDLTAAGFEAMGWKVVYNSTPNLTRSWTSRG
jgi:predicted metalloprotease with PDZ domain